MPATMPWGEVITVTMAVGFPTNQFVLNDPIFGLLDGQGVLDGNLLGIDVSTYVMEVNIRRGRSSELDAFEAGSASITLNNNDRRFDPINTSSPYWDATTGRSGVQPRRDVVVYSDGQAIFSGAITDIFIDYNGDLSTATFQCADDFSILSNSSINTAFTPAVQIAGNRVSTILDLPEVNYSLADRTISVAGKDMGAYPISAPTTVLPYLQKVALADNAFLYMSRDGKITYTAPNANIWFYDVQAEFYDDVVSLPAGAINYTGIRTVTDQTFLYNQVVVGTEASLTDTSFNDTTSQSAFGISSLDMTGLLLDQESDALALGVELLTKYAYPVYRFDDLQFVINGMLTTARQNLNTLELVDGVKVVRTFATGTPSTVTDYYQVERVEHQITPTQHNVTIGLGDLKTVVYPFVLAGYPPVTRTNLILNPNFETDVSTWVGGNGATISRTTSYQVSGVASALLTSSATDYNNMQLPTRITVLPNTAYSLSAYCRNISGSTRLIYIAVQWYTAGGTYISEINSGGSGTLSTAAGWVRRSCSGTTPANAASAQIVFLTGQTGLSAGWQSAFDAVLFEQSASVLPYFDGTYADAYTGYALETKAWTGTANASASYGYWYQGATRTNFVTNPSLETDATGWSAASSPQVRSTDFAISGVASFKVTMSSASDNNIMANTPNFVGTGNATFSVYAYVPTGSTLAGLSVTLSVEGGTATSTAVSSTPAVLVAGSWVRMSITRNVTVAGTMVVVGRLSVLPSTRAGQNIYFDAALAEFASSALPYFDGAGTAPYTGYTLTSIGWNGTANASTSTANWGLDTAYVFENSILDSTNALV
jgi:hypothetical protein